jgi:hypothetical protein
LFRPSLAEFLAYYEAAHRNVANCCIHHVAHAVAAVGALFHWRPLLGTTLIAVGFMLSWTGHYPLERNTPAFFGAPTSNARGAALAKKLQVALGGIA